MTSSHKITIPLPDDWHLHLRDGEILKKVLPYSETNFGRAIIMPNLNPPVVTHEQATAYKTRILTACQSTEFEPLMTLYLTEQTDPHNLRIGFQQGAVVACKLYPAGATTNSASGVKQISAVYPVLETMEALGMPLLVHGEVTDPHVDIFDREAVFIEQTLAPLLKRFPKLKLVLEHVTTLEGVNFVKSQTSGMAATVTPHHLVINRNAIFAGGLRPHYYCLPIAKREIHREALVEAVVSGDARFFLGTDSAPHSDSNKEMACGCAGIFNVPVCLSVLAHVFENAGALHQLAGFTSLHGASFYGREVNRRQLSLVKKETPLPLPDQLKIKDETVTVFDPGFPLYWDLAGL